ncbi:HAUS augmin-like complex subunit 6 isoform X2 [Carlito syrichta]|uniref:HAUS augmin-like complex subunit 6 isoform X2 n=1 Tax=Carlito syrichta TaxID=1868482 RepID=A0A1U7UAL4_CARSF|nr:HAUS augmin-like complex subunit 6 isoform X2 [Carlito syrichta]
MSSASAPSFEKQHLWMYLQALGFDPGPATAACGKVVSHTHLGVNMFDKQNRDAFYIVSYFLFQTLDQSLTKEVFKLCWPPFDQKSDAEFRKHCCEWLKRISAECEIFPQVVGSLFLSPGGPKFIHLMYHFARYVALKYIKTNSRNSSLFPKETFNVKPQDLHKCIARCHVARNRFLQILQREDYVIKKYQENAQLLVKQVRNARSECIGLQNQIKEMEPYDDPSNIEEKIEKVRSLWASVNETLKFLEKEREVVSSVLSLANQYTLDGTNVVINIPSLLCDKIQKQMSQLHIGNIYEAGKLNLLTVIQVLNEVLKILKYERCQTDQARLTVDLHYLEKETKFQRERLSDLKHMSLVEGWTPAVDLLPPMSPLSFDPASEETYAKSILFQYPASLPDTPELHNQENDCRGDSDNLGAVHDLANSSVSLLLQPASSSDRSSVTVLGKDTKVRLPKDKNETVSKKIPEFEMEDSPLSDIAKSSQAGGSLPTKKSDPFHKEQDHLAEEVVKAVLSDSPQVSEGKDVKLEELIDHLGSNPFLTRNRIPRTPESLITEIRSSWRKAINTEDNRNMEPIQMDTEHFKEVLPESLPVLHNQRESSMASFFSGTSVSEFDQSHFPEEKVVLDYKCLPQKQVVTGHIGESLTQNQSDLLDKKVFCKQDLECVALPTKLSETSRIETFSPAVGTRVDVMTGSKDTKTLDHSQASYNKPSMSKTLLWNSFQVSSGISSPSFKDTDFGILHETLPEVGRLSFCSSSSSEANFKLEPNSPVYSDVFPEGFVGERQTTSESDLNLQAICRRYEAQKKSLCEEREESYLPNPETFERHKPELSPTPQNMQTDDMLSFLDTHDLHTDYAKPSLRMSLGERKRSLSPLIKFSPEQRSRTTIPCSLGELLPNLKEEDILNKSLDEKESPT